jgi:hypothetical protein
MSTDFPPFKPKPEPIIEKALVLVFPPKDVDPVHGAKASDAILLLGSGPGIESDHEAGLSRDEYAVVLAAPDEPGLWIFVGYPRWIEERSEGVLEGCVPEYDGCGEWRRPTTNEAVAFAVSGKLDL